MFKKKEKPVAEYSIAEICSHALYMKEFTYIPTKVTCYESKIELCIDRVEEESADVVSFTVVAFCSGERLIPVEIDGMTLYWDTKELVFRVKRLPEGEPTPLIPQVLLYPNEVMTMERGFAEEWLSPLALSYATLQENRYVWYYPDGSAAPVVFEIPRLFAGFNEAGDHPLNGGVLAAINQLTTYAPDYVEENGLIPENIFARYSENLKRGI